jgi:hypothetical protein
MPQSIKCYVKESDLVTRKIAGETIVVPIKKDIADMESIYTFNELGSRIWHLMDQRTNINQIVDVICSEYDVNREEAERDVMDFLEELEREGLIKAI